MNGDAGRSWCVVTGASAGIGLALTRQLLEDGHCVAGVGRHAAAMDALRALWPRRFVSVSHDVSHGGLAERLVHDGVPLADIDLVVHSAGCARQGSSLVDMAEADVRDVVSTNVLGSVLVMREMSAVLMRRGSGTLVVLGSVAAHDEAPLMAVYAASKAFVQQLVRCVRADLHGSRVRLACVQPGTTRTALLDGQPGLSAEQRFDGFVPLEAFDVAQAIRWIHQQPPHVNIQDISVYPVAQSMYVRGVHRQGQRTSAAGKIHDKESACLP